MVCKQGKVLREGGGDLSMYSSRLTSYSIHGCDEKVLGGGERQSPMSRNG